MEQKENQIFRKHCESIVTAIFFTVFVMGYSMAAGWIVAIITAVTGVIALGWIAAAIVTVYLLHSGLFSAVFSGWLNIGKHIANAISDSYCAEQQTV